MSHTFITDNGNGLDRESILYRLPTRIPQTRPSDMSNPFLKKRLTLPPVPSEFPPILPPFPLTFLCCQSGTGGNWKGRHDEIRENVKGVWKKRLTCMRSGAIGPALAVNAEILAGTIGTKRRRRPYDYPCCDQAHRNHA